MKKLIIVLMICIPIAFVGCSSDSQVNDNIGEVNESAEDKIDFAVDSKVGSEQFGFTDLPMSWNDLHLGHSHDYIEYGDSEEKYTLKMYQRALLEGAEIVPLMEKTAVSLEESGARDVKVEDVILDGVEGAKLSAIGERPDGIEVLYTLWVVSNDGYFYAMELESIELEVDSLVSIIENGFSFVG